MQVRKSKKITLSKSMLLYLIRWAIFGLHDEYYSGDPAYFNECDEQIKHLKKLRTRIRKGEDQF